MFVVRHSCVFPSIQVPINWPIKWVSLSHVTQCTLDKEHKGTLQILFLSSLSHSPQGFSPQLSESWKEKCFYLLLILLHSLTSILLSINEHTYICIPLLLLYSWCDIYLDIYTYMYMHYSECYIILMYLYMHGCRFLCGSFVIGGGGVMNRSSPNNKRTAEKSTPMSTCMCYHPFLQWIAHFMCH